jgi:hypothetical protein
MLAGARAKRTMQGQATPHDRGYEDKHGIIPCIVSAWEHRASTVQPHGCTLLGTHALMCDVRQHCVQQMYARCEPSCRRLSCTREGFGKWPRNSCTQSVDAAHLASAASPVTWTAASPGQAPAACVVPSVQIEIISHKMFKFSNNLAPSPTTHDVLE